MKYFRSLLLASVVAVPGQPFAHELSGTQAVMHAKAPHSTCPSREFSAFLSMFSESVDIQRDFTRYPLERQHLDLGTSPEPKPVVRSLQRNQVSFPVIPGAAERKLKSLSLRVENVDYGAVKLLLVKADTDYQVVYLFRRDSCWSLYRIEDWSL